MKTWKHFRGMSRLFGVSLGLAILLLAGCYQGVSNSEIVRIVDVKAQPPDRVAMLVERSDHAALSGNTFFVFVSDRVYEVAELRKKLYALHPVFMDGLGEGLSLRWTAHDELTIQCQNCHITKDIIEKQLYSQNGVTIRYVDFP